MPRHMNIILIWLTGYTEGQHGGGEDPCRELHPSEEPGSKLQEDERQNRRRGCQSTDGRHDETSHWLHGGCRQVHGVGNEIYEFGKGKLLIHFLGNTYVLQ